MSDDFGSTPATAGLLTIGSSIQGNFESGFDSDMFKVTLSAGSTYLLGLSQMKMPYLGYMYNPLTVLLEAADGTVLDSESAPLSYQTFGDSSLPVIQFAPKASGEYLLVVRDDTVNPGSYTVGAAVQAPDDIPSDPSTTATLTPGGTTHANFEVAGDRDWFKFHVEAGQHYSFGYTPADADTVVPSVFRLYDSAGHEVQNWGYPFEPMASGDYYLSAEGMQVGAYGVTEKLLQDDFSSNDSSPGRLPVGGKISGSLEYQGDKDNFKITVQAGTSYGIELSGDPQDQKFLSFYVFDSNGQQVSIPTYTTSSGALHGTLTAASSGEYSVKVYGSTFFGTGLVTHGPYTLSATAAAADDYGDTPATAGSVTVGGAVHGTLQSGQDVDMFQATLQAGTTYTFSLQPDDAKVPGSGSQTLKLTDAAGQVLATSYYDHPGTVSFTPAATGSYFVGASDSQVGVAPLAYSLSSALAVDDVGANAASAGVLPVGGKVAGNLETAGDRDWFAAQLNAGTTYWFKLAGSADQSGTLMPGAGTVFRVVDAQGHEYASVHGVYGAELNPLSFAPAASGTYYVEVAYPGVTGTYQVSAQVGTKDDYGDDAAHATEITLNAGLTGALQLRNDKDVFKLMVTAGTAYSLLVDRADGKGYWPGGWPLATDASGQQIALHVTNSSDSNFTFTATSSGPVYFTLGTDTPSPYSSDPGGYHLLATSLGVDDYPGDSTTTAVLPANGQFHGTLNTPNDSDWIKVHMEAGKDYSFDLLGKPTGDGTLDTVGASAGLVLHGPASSFLFGLGGGTWQTHLRAQATVTGDYYLEVQNGSAPSSHTGSYTVSMSSAFDDHQDPHLVSTSMVPGAVGVSLNSTIVLTYSEPIAMGWSSWMLRENNGNFPGFTQLDGTRVHLGTGALSNTVTIDLTGLLHSGTSYAMDLSYGMVKDLADNANQSGGTLTFTTKYDAPPPAPQTGTAGNDVLHGTGNGSTLSGGDGIDTASYGFARSAYVINRVNGQLIVELNDSVVGDKLDGVERLDFSDAHIAVDINGHGGQAYRMYQAAFNRTPDAAGGGYWMSVLDKGASLRDVAGSFVNSAEFISKYGSAPTDAQFVDLLYQNVLHRTGDQAGVDYWMQALHNGMSRADGLMNFSESAENQAGVLTVIGSGFAYTPWHS